MGFWGSPGERGASGEMAYPTAFLGCDQSIIAPSMVNVYQQCAKRLICFFLTPPCDDIVACGGRRDSIRRLAQPSTRSEVLGYTCLLSLDTLNLDYPPVILITNLPTPPEGGFPSVNGAFQRDYTIVVDLHTDPKLRIRSSGVTRNFQTSWKGRVFCGRRKLISANRWCVMSTRHGSQIQYSPQVTCQ